MAIKTKIKNKILIIAFFLIMVATCVLFVGITRVLPVKILLIVSVLVLYLYAMPSFNNNYRYLLGWEEKDWKVYIPIYNEIYPLGTITGISSIIILVLFIVSCILSFIPPSSYNHIVSDSLSLIIPQMMIKVTVYLLILFNIILGVGYCSIISQINTLYSKAFNLGNVPAKFIVKAIGKFFRLFPILLYVFLFVPVVRVLCLLFISDKMEALVETDITFYNIDEEDMEEF